MAVQVEILIPTITAEYGSLSAGDTLRTSAAFAAHLVNDCCCARYTAVSDTVTAGPAEQVAPSNDESPSVAKPRAARSGKQKPEANAKVQTSAQDTSDRLGADNGAAGAVASVEAVADAQPPQIDIGTVARETSAEAAIDQDLNVEQG